MVDVGREAPSVALLGRDDAVRNQLRTALTELGANLVYEGQLRGAVASEVSASQPSVVLLNLDAGGEDALDHLDDLLLDPSMRVIFNEAETTATLSGWDLARWARHLAAKVMGHDRTIPPPPEGAEFLPDHEMLLEPGAPASPESQAAPLSMEVLASEATESMAQVPASTAPTRRDDGDTAANDSATDAPELSDLLVDVEAIDSAMTAVEAAPAEVLRSTSEAESGAGDADEHALAVDFDELDAALAAIDAGDDAGGADVADFSVESIELDTGDADAAPRADSLQAELEALALETESAADDAATIGEDLDSFSVSDDSVGTLSFSSEAEELSGELDADVAALAAQLDAMPDSAPRGEMAVQDLDFSSASHGDASDDESADRPAKPKPAASGSGSGSDLSLTDELGELQVASAPRPYTPPPEINISHLSLEALPDPGLLVEKAKPKAAPDEPYLPRPGIDLELAPLHGNDETSPAKPQKRHSAVEADLGSDHQAGGLTLEPIGDEAEAAPAKAGIRRVVVLGASIGGPDALRTFLAGLPANFPALLVLAQHLESGFFDRLGQQLQKVSKLPVRVANAGTSVRAGEVVIVPSGERFRIDAEGQVSSEPYDGPTHYKPCIDDVMHDVADAFGPRATAIIFSGMAGDAVEGAVYITSKGGEVWAQKPESCVVSSMVDGAQARGVVEFVGSPRELAEHCIARFGNG